MRSHVYEMLDWKRFISNEKRQDKFMQWFHAELNFGELCCKILQLQPILTVLTFKKMKEPESKIKQAIASAVLLDPQVVRMFYQVFSTTLIEGTKVIVFCWSNVDAKKKKKS